jgi:hypothetical protein
MLLTRRDFNLEDTLHKQLVRLIETNVNPVKVTQVNVPRLHTVKYYDIEDIRMVIGIKYKHALVHGRWAKFIPRWDEFYRILKGIEDDRARV